MKKSIFFLSALASLLFTACKDYDDDVIKPERNSVVEDVKPDVSTVSEAKVFFFSSGIADYMLTPLKQRFPNQVSSPGMSNIIFISSNDLAANSDALQRYMANGIAVVEVVPDIEKHKAWMEDIKMPYLDDNSPMLLIATSKNDAYNLRDNIDDEPVEGENEDGDYTEGDPIDPTVDKDGDYDVKYIPRARTAEYCNTLLNSFVTWADSYINNLNPPYQTTGDDVEEPNIMSKLSDLISDANYTYHFKTSDRVGFDSYKIAKVMWSDADKVYNKYMNYDLDVWITPLYAYKEAGVNSDQAKGDYYYVKTCITSYSKDMCQKYRKWHGAVVTHGFAFYLKEMNFTASMKPSDKSSYTIKFAQTPTPVTTSGTSSYNSGFSSTLNINGQGGLVGGKPTLNINVGGSFTWSSSSSRTLSDLSIENNTQTDCTVKYKYNLNGLKGEDELEDAVPAIGRTTRYDEASWIWHVNGKEKDNDENTYYMMTVNVNPIFGYAYRHATWGCEGNFKTANTGTKTVSFKMPVPNRKTAGIIEFMNTNSNIITKIEIKDITTGNIVSSFNSAYMKGQLLKRQVPTGTYNVEYVVADGDDGTVIQKRRINNVVVSTSKTAQISTITKYDVI